MVLEPKNVDLDGPEFDDMDDNDELLQSSVLLQTGNQPLVKKKILKDRVVVLLNHFMKQS